MGESGWRLMLPLAASGSWGGEICRALPFRCEPESDDPTLLSAGRKCERCGEFLKKPFDVGEDASEGESECSSERLRACGISRRTEKPWLVDMMMGDTQV